MHHYTLNTGHSRVSPRSEVGPEAVALCRDLIRNGGGTVLTAFRVVITEGEGSAIFDVRRADHPIVLCGVAWTTEGAAEVWPELESTYLQLSDQHPQFYAPAIAPVKPPTLPWLAVLILPTIALQSRDDIGWLGDFERCLAWALIESEP